MARYNYAAAYDRDGNPRQNVLLAWIMVPGSLTDVLTFSVFPSHRHLSRPRLKNVLLCSYCCAAGDGRHLMTSLHFLLVSFWP